MAVAFASDGIRTFRRFNKIDNLRPRDGWTAVALPPPLALQKLFSRSGCGRIFPLFSGVMREGLSTGRGTRRPENGLWGPLFSRPDDCNDFGEQLQVPVLIRYFWERLRYIWNCYLDGKRNCRRTNSVWQQRCNVLLPLTSLTQSTQPPLTGASEPILFHLILRPQTPPRPEGCSVSIPLLTGGFLRLQSTEILHSRLVPSLRASGFPVRVFSLRLLGLRDPLLSHATKRLPGPVSNVHPSFSRHRTRCERSVRGWPSNSQRL